MKAKTLLIVSIIAATAIYWFINTSEGTSEHKNEEMVSSTEMTSVQSSSSVNNNIPNTTLTNSTTIDRGAIMRISEELEYCVQEELQYKALSQQSLPELFALLRNETSADAQEQALTYLVQQKLLHHQNAVAYFERFLQKQLQHEYRIVSTTGNQQNQISLDDYEYFMSEMGALDNALNNTSPAELEQWLQNKDDILSNTFVMSSSNENTYLSAGSAVLKHFPSLNTNMQNWILNNMRFTAFDLHIAIKNGLPTEHVKQVLQATDNPEQPFPGANGKITNLLGSSLQYGDSGLTEHIIEYGLYSDQRMATPVVNQYLESLVSTGLVTQDDRNKISLLANNQLSPTTIYNSRVRADELVGYQNQGLTQTILAPFMNDELTLQNASLAIQSQADQIALSSQFLSKVSALKTLKEQQYEAKQQCLPLKQQQISLEPAFGDVRDYINLVADLGENAEKLALLSETSPVLYDLLAWELINAAPEKDLRHIKQQYNDIGSNDITQVLTLGDTAMPHQQNYLASLVCLDFGAKVLFQIFNRNWFINFESTAFNLCRQQIKDFHDLEEQFQASANKQPSRLYMLIKSMNYQDAITLLETNSGIHGLSHGRDALSLLLDRMIPFRAKTQDHMFTLLELLLAKTTLTDMHLSRLNRLELKYPSYYSALSTQYPQLKTANTVAPNLYISFL